MDQLFSLGPVSGAAEILELAQPRAKRRNSPTSAPIGSKRYNAVAAKRGDRTVVGDGCAV
jgi:hypothetical protein